MEKARNASLDALERLKPENRVIKLADSTYGDVSNIYGINKGQNQRSETVNTEYIDKNAKLS